VACRLSHWDRLQPNADADAADEWAEVVLKLWEFQWVRNPTELDEWTLQVLYECTQGVLGILTALFATSQMQAMLNRSERLTPQLIQQVYQLRFKVVHPMIAALRDHNEAALQRYQDIAPPLEKVLDSIWTMGDPSVLAGTQLCATTTAAPMDGVSPADTRAGRRTRIRSRVATARLKGSKSTDHNAELTCAEFDPDDYRNAIKAAQERNTSVFEELQRLRLVPSTQEFLEMLW